MDSGQHHEPFAGKGEFYALMRATDWSRTALGPVESWPATLVGYVRMVLDMPTPAIIFWGPDQTQIYNAGYATIMGPRHPRFFGGPYRESWPETYPTIYPWMRRVLARGEVARVENEHIAVARYGFEEEAYFTFTFSPLRDDHGRIAGILQPVFEVTASVLSARRAETLRALEPRSDPADGIDTAVATLAANSRDVPFALFYLWNESAQRLDLASQSDYLPAGLAAQFQPCVREAFETKALVTVETVESMLNGERMGPWPESPRAAVVIPVGGAGPEGPRGVAVFGLSPRLHFDEHYRSFLEVAAVQVVARMALQLEREQRRREARRQRQYLTDLFTHAPAAIAVVRGSEHVFELSNPRYQQLIGEDRDVVGKPIREALPELVGQPFFRILEDVYRSGEPFVGTEMPAQFPRDGEERPAEQAFFNFVYQPMNDVDGTVDGVLVFAYEVSDQVHARRRVELLMEELKLEQRRKDEFLAMLAHELRNPLAAVHNAVSLLESPGLAAEVPQRYVAILRRQTRTLTSLVDDLLDVSRITRGLVELSRERLDVATVIERALESVQPQIDEKRHEVSVTGPREPVTVIGDPVRLEQILVNLLTNAAKYTDTGGHIGVLLGHSDGQAEVRVQDTGIGLEPQVLEQIFSLFGQAERGLDRAEGGLGIGLTIVRTLVELHGGTIEAASEGLRKGAEFVVRLPLAPAAAEHEQAQPTAPEPLPAARTRVLLVDDNVDAADTLALLLRAVGHAVTVVYDGAAALASLDEQVPECVLLDIGLPGMDGYEVAERLRQDPRTEKARIAALTGYGQKRDLQRTREAAFDAHFVKPVDLDTIRGFIGGAPGRQGHDGP